MNFISRLDVNFLDLTQNFDKVSKREIKVKGTGSKCLLEECVKDNYYAGFILAANTDAKKLTLSLDST